MKNTTFLLLFLLMVYVIDGIGQDADRTSGLKQLAERMLDQSNNVMQANIDSSLTLAYQVDSLATLLSDFELMMKVKHHLGFIYYNQNNFERAIDYFEESRKLAVELSNPHFEALALNRLGNSYQLRTNYLLALDYYQQALAINVNTKNLGEVARTKVNLANVYSIIGQYQRSIQLFLEAMEIHESIDEREGLAWTSLGIARLFKRLEILDKAMYYAESALHFYREIEHRTGNSTGVTLCLNEMGSIFHKLGDFDRALDYTLQVLEINIKRGNVHGQASNHLSLGVIAFDKKDNSLALLHLNRALALKEQVGDSLDLARLYRFLGEVSLRTNDKNMALAYTKQSLFFSEKHRQLPEISEGYHLLARIYQTMKQFDKALDAHVSFTAYRDSLNSSDISRLEMQYEFEKREKEQELIVRQREALQEARLERQRVVIVFFVVAFLLVGSLAAFIFYAFKEKQRINSILVKQNDEISRQKHEIESQKEEIEQQRDFVTRQRDQIAEQQRLITDSITYASRIQNAVLPSDSTLRRLPWESFVFYKPKNIVSGDFYWVSELSNGKIMVAVADCTGHGVPGAFMSMLGITLLREISGKAQHLSPAEILQELRRMVILSLNQQTGRVDQADGMDMAITLIDKKSLMMEFAAAYQSVIVIREGDVHVPKDQENPRVMKLNDYSLVELRGNKMPIGYHVSGDKPFTNLAFQLLPNDTLYLFSDGYIDQFGGPNNIKFLMNNFKNLLLGIQNKSLDHQKEIIKSTITDFQGERKQVDDMVVLGIKLT